MGPNQVVFIQLECFYVAKRFIKDFFKPLNSAKINLYFAIAALLHDLGHGPLNHTSETIFARSEFWSRIWFKTMPITSILKNSGLTFLMKLEIYLNLNLFSKPLKTIISSEIDCDRLDYLLRDSYNTE